MRVVVGLSAKQARPATFSATAHGMMAAPPGTSAQVTPKSFETYMAASAPARAAMVQ